MCHVDGRTETMSVTASHLAQSTFYTMTSTLNTAQPRQSIMRCSSITRTCYINNHRGHTQVAKSAPWKNESGIQLKHRLLQVTVQSCAVVLLVASHLSSLVSLLLLRTTIQINWDSFLSIMVINRPYWSILHFQKQLDVMACFEDEAGCMGQAKLCHSNKTPLHPERLFSIKYSRIPFGYICICYIW
jgi:hypothetical protein